MDCGLKCNRNVHCTSCSFGVHVTGLVWLSSLFKSVDEANRTLQSCRSVASFFRASGIRTLELTKVAESIDVSLLRFLEYKEVRMTEFIANLFRVMIRNLPGLFTLLET